MRAPAGSPGVTTDWLGGKPGHWCLPAVSAPDGYGMILLERRVDLEDATYRVIWVALDP